MTIIERIGPLILALILFIFIILMIGTGGGILDPLFWSTL